MKLPIDTHALLWYIDQDHLLSPIAHAAMTDPSNEILVSAATIWEVSIKVGLGKLTISFPYAAWMTKAIADLRATVLPITVDYADAQTSLPKHHRDPFDRILIAQAMVEGVPLVSADSLLDAYGIARLW